MPRGLRRKAAQMCILSADPDTCMPSLQARDALHMLELLLRTQDAIRLLLACAKADHADTRGKHSESCNVSTN